MSQIEDDIRRATEAIRASRPRSLEPVHYREITFAEGDTDFPLKVGRWEVFFPETTDAVCVGKVTVSSACPDELGDYIFQKWEPDE